MRLQKKGSVCLGAGLELNSTGQALTSGARCKGVLSNSAESFLLMQYFKELLQKSTLNKI